MPFLNDKNLFKISPRIDHKGFSYFGLFRVETERLDKAIESKALEGLAQKMLDLFGKSEQEKIDAARQFTQGLTKETAEDLILHLLFSPNRANPDLCEEIAGFVVLNMNPEIKSSCADYFKVLLRERGTLKPIYDPQFISGGAEGSTYMKNGVQTRYYVLQRHNLQHSVERGYPPSILLNILLNSRDLFANFPEEKMTLDHLGSYTPDQLHLTQERITKIATDLKATQSFRSFYYTSEKLCEAIGQELGEIYDRLDPILRKIEVNAITAMKQTKVQSFRDSFNQLERTVDEIASRSNEMLESGQIQRETPSTRPRSPRSTAHRDKTGNYL